MIQNLVENQKFERFILVIIFINSLTLGLETVPSVAGKYSYLLMAIDHICLWIFTVEIFLKLYINRFRTFKDPWNVFDILVVSISWLPAAGAFSVLRSLRVLRALRVISTVPRLRRVITGLLHSLPGLGAVSTIILLLFYVGAVISTKLFGEAFPEWFGSIAKSTFSLFQIMTLESWSMGIVRPVMEAFPYAWAFFVPFILVTTFTTLNLLIAVLVNAMQAETEEVAEVRAQASHDERIQMLEDLATIKKQLSKLVEK